jgi:glycosyltransferase involved in cell wall biosynthesis
MKTVSVVVPCYNCLKTLPAAIASIHHQTVRDRIELILVDDGSVDGTREYLETLGGNDRSISVWAHETNRGGGAARNTGISHATGDFVLCFDADDLLEPRTIELLVKRLQEEDLDGATFAGRYSFSRTPRKARFQDFTHSGKVIALANVFDGSQWPVGVNFLYRRAAYAKVGGYPENNGFDTQGFGIHFLAHGLKAAAAPGAFFYQRQFGGDASYFERAYMSGEYSAGFFLVLEKLYRMFSPGVRRTYLGFPIFSGSDFSNSLTGVLTDQFRSAPDAFFITETIGEAQNLPGAEDRWTGVLDSFCKKDWPAAAAGVVSSLDDGVHHEVAGFMIQRILSAATGSGESIAEVRRFADMIALTPHGRNTLRESTLQKARRKMRKLLVRS